MWNVFDVDVDHYYQPSVNFAAGYPPLGMPFVRDADRQRVPEHEQGPLKADSVLTEVRDGFLCVPGEPVAHEGSYVHVGSQHLQERDLVP